MDEKYLYKDYRKMEEEWELESYKLEMEKRRKEQICYLICNVSAVILVTALFITGLVTSI